MSNPEDGFELPNFLLEATNDDAQSVLDSLDALLIDAADSTSKTDSDASLGLFLDDEVAKQIINDIAGRQRMTPDQLLQQAHDMRTHHLQPVEGMEEFQVKRFSMTNRGTLGIIIRLFPDDLGGLQAAHIHETEHGLKLDFDYDTPGSKRATVSDCEDIKRQLGSTWVI